VTDPRSTYSATTSNPHIRTPERLDFVSSKDYCFDRDKVKIARYLTVTSPADQLTRTNLEREAGRFGNAFEHFISRRVRQ